MAILMSDSIQHRSLVWLCRELKRAKMALWNAKERNAPSTDIENLTNKIEILEYLIDGAIKETR